MRTIDDNYDNNDESDLTPTQHQRVLRGNLSKRRHMPSTTTKLGDLHVRSWLLRYIVKNIKYESYNIIKITKKT